MRATVASAAVAAACAAMPTMEALMPLLNKGLESRVAKHLAMRDAGELKEISVETKYGTVVGVNSTNVYQYLGIPFAQQPVGDLRWKSPVEPLPWGTLNATWWGPGCIQSETTWTLYTGQDEGCLFINYYVPAKAPPAGGFPVMFFMHGGSWEFGSGSFILYDGEMDVGMTEDVIVATINYRLNVFGFLAGDALKAESPDGSVGNYGFQDQRRALQFVIDTIADFGGNPNLITIFGESAGGGSTSSHLVAPRSRGMFQRAMIESGSWAAWTAQPYNISATRLAQVAANVNCGGAADVLSCMRALPAATIFKPGSNGVTSKFLTWSPVIDGVELSADPRVLLASGQVADVPILFGANMNEGTLFNNAKTDLNASDYLAAIEDVIGVGLGPQIAAEYPASEFSTPWWGISAILGDAMMVCPAVRNGAILTNPAIYPSRASPVYVYYYTHIFWVIEYIVDLFKPLGCFHGSELINVFDLSILQLGPGEKELGDAFVNYWTNFAITGNPNGAGVPNWPTYGSMAGGVVAQLDTSASGVNVTSLVGLKAPLCAFWGNITITPETIFGTA